MSRYYKTLPTVEQQKEKIILLSRNDGVNVSVFFRTRFGVFKTNNLLEYDSSLQTMDPISKIAFATNGGVNDVAIDASSNIYVGGSFTSYRNLTNNRIIKLLPNGDKDTTFDNTTGFNDGVTKMYLDSNNKLYCFGFFTTYKGVAANRIIRLNPDGTKDNLFNNSTGFNNSISEFSVDSNGKIYCVGFFTTYKGVTCNRIVRLNTDGSLDNTFNIGTGFNGGVTSIFIDNSDKIFVTGNFTTYNSISANSIIKLNNDGTVDNSFNYGSGFTNNFGNPIIKSDEIGNIYVSIGSSKYKNSLNNYGVWKIDSSGNFVSNLNTSPNLSGPSWFFVIDSDNVILPRLSGTVLLVNSVGQVKKLLFTNPGGNVGLSNIRKDISGNYYFFGAVENNEIFDKSFGLGMPLNESGNIVPNKFNQNLGLTLYQPGQQIKMIKTKNNNLIFFGGVSEYNNQTTNSFISLTLNGSLNNQFKSGVGFPFADPNQKLDSDYDGNLYCYTTNTSYKSEIINPSFGNVLFKIKQNGDRDATFNPIPFSSFDSGEVMVQPDNKILFLRGSSDIITISGQNYNKIVRLNQNGTIDNTFSARTWSNTSGFSASLTLAHIDTNIKSYFISQYYGLQKYDNTFVGSILRLNSDGSLDNTFTTFGSPFGGSIPSGLLVDKYNKIWVWGSFTSFSGLSNNCILRLNYDGTIDNTFNNSIGFNSSVGNLEIDEDTDKIYITGSFTTYKGNNSRYLISLNYDGTINTSFNVSPKNAFMSVVKIFIINN